MNEKIAFVCQRYGLEINGGAELYCRQIAEKLTAIYDVTVYTTCAIDYITWRNEYKPGSVTINNVHVKRFLNHRERNIESFDIISNKILNNKNHTNVMEKEWINQQGPYCHDLLISLLADRQQYKKIFFMTYLYYTTALGMTYGFDNAILIPTVHNEPPVYLRFYEKVFSNAKFIVWNTEEEKSFANKRFPFLKSTPGDTVGLGIETPQKNLPAIPTKLEGKKYLVYAGRIDKSKGCEELFDYYIKYRDSNKTDMKLVLLGKPVMDIPNDHDIISLGFVSEEMKFSIMREAFALVLCSRYESLSMVVLESMLMGRPVLVSGYCEVLKGHCLRSNAGLFFYNYKEFEASINYYLSNTKQYEIMRDNGKKYVEKNYNWDVIIQKYKSIIEMD